MRRLIHILLCFVLLPAISARLHGQTYNVWAFQYRTGLDFNTEPPKPIHSELGGYSTSCASICDSSGKLLFYTDGFNVYSKNHQIMQNGDSLCLSAKGQGALILPVPNKPAQFYFIAIHHLEQLMNVPMGIYYSVVDLSYNNGLGKVLQRNNNLIEGDFRGLCAIRHANTKDIWLTSKGLSDTFYSFLLKDESIEKKYITSVASGENTYEGQNSYQGNMKTSHDGRLIANAYWVPRDSAGRVKYFTYFILYDFDKSSGLVHNKRIIDSLTWNFFSDSDKKTLHEFYDIAFSPNDSLIYVTDFMTIPLNGDMSNILQYERHAPDIRASRVELPIHFARGIQLAPNGKIYVVSQMITSGTSQGAIAVIHYPDKKGLKCQVQNDIISFPGDKRYPSYVFPNMFYEYTRAKFDYTPTCAGIKFKNLCDLKVFTKFSWYFTDTDSSEAFEPLFSFPASGRYLVKLKAQNEKGYAAWFSDTVNYIKPPLARFGYAESATGCQWAGFAFLDSSSTDTLAGESMRYLWQFGDGGADTAQNPVHVYKAAGTYTVRLIVDNGFCTDTLSRKNEVDILPAPMPGFSLSDTSGCSPFVVYVREGSMAGEVVNRLYDLGDGRTDARQEFKAVYETPGVYKIKQSLEGPTGCISRDSMFITVKPGLNGKTPEILRASFTESGDSIEVKWLQYEGILNYTLYKSGMQGTIAQVMTGTSYAEYADKSGGTYFINMTDSCGNVSALSPPASPPILKADYNDNAGGFELHWSPYLLWRQGIEQYRIEKQDSAGNFYLLSAGRDTVYDDYSPGGSLQECYRITALEHNGNGQKSLSNIACSPYAPKIYFPDIFTPNADSLNEVFIPLTSGIKSLHLIIYNRWGECIYSGEDLNEGWDGTFKRKAVPEGIYFYTLKARGSNNEMIYRTGNFQLTR